VEVQKTNNKKHISYSELKDWYFCAFKHKLIHIDKLKIFQGNVHTAFGTAIHSVAENQIKNDNNIEDWNSFFLKAFLKELKTLSKEHLVENKKLIEEMKVQGLNIIKYISPEIKKHFGDFKVVGIEDKLYEHIIEYKNRKISFKGFIDLVIQTSDQKYHIIDLKTCSWGWNLEKKSDVSILYQLMLYKLYFSQKYEIEEGIKNIQTHFILLKRTAKKDFVEIFTPTSGQKRLDNAKHLLLTSLTNIDNKRYVKNRSKCERCEFFMTKHCSSSFGYPKNV